MGNSGSCCGPQKVYGEEKTEKIPISKTENPNITSVGPKRKPKISIPEFFEKPMNETVENNQNININESSIKFSKNWFQNIKFFTIGDIESQKQKLIKFAEFIKANPEKDVVFLGDLFDDISWKAKERQDGLDCIKILDDNGFLENGKVLEKITDFKEIHFQRREYNEIGGRYKFIIGNSEFSALLDIMSDIEDKKPDEDGYYNFHNRKARDDKYDKKLTFEELSLLYKYLTCCCGCITLGIENNKQILIRHSKDSLHFKNYPNFDDLHQIKPDQNNIVICGHYKVFGKFEDYAYINDTSYNNYKKENSDDFSYDQRLNAVEIKDGNVEVETINLDFSFKKVFKCPNCNFYFNTEEVLQNHIDTKHAK